MLTFDSDEIEVSDGFFYTIGNDKAKIEIELGAGDKSITDNFNVSLYDVLEIVSQATRRINSSFWGGIIKWKLEQY